MFQSVESKKFQKFQIKKHLKNQSLENSHSAFCPFSLDVSIPTIHKKSKKWLFFGGPTVNNGISPLFGHKLPTKKLAL